MTSPKTSFLITSMKFPQDVNFNRTIVQVLHRSAVVKEITTAVEFFFQGLYCDDCEVSLYTLVSIFISLSLIQYIYFFKRHTNQNHIRKRD